MKGDARAIHLSSRDPKKRFPKVAEDEVQRIIEDVKVVELLICVGGTAHCKHKCSVPQVQRYGDNPHGEHHGVDNNH